MIPHWTRVKHVDDMGRARFVMEFAIRKEIQVARQELANTKSQMKSFMLTSCTTTGCPHPAP
jgi:hypothetical protein